MECKAYKLPIYFKYNMSQVAQYFIGFDSLPEFLEETLI